MNIIAPEYFYKNSFDKRNGAITNFVKIYLIGNTIFFRHKSDTGKPYDDFFKIIYDDNLKESFDFSVSIYLNTGWKPYEGKEYERNFCQNFNS